MVPASRHFSRPGAASRMYMWSLVVVYAQVISPWPSAQAAGSTHHVDGASTMKTRYGSNLQGLGMQLQASNFLCRTLGRCLLQDAPSPEYSSYSPDNPPSPGPPPPPDLPVDTPMPLPTLPADPESSSTSTPPPPAARTNPSTLLTPPFSSFRKAGASSNNTAGKVGISAGVGVSGILLVILGLLYYFKPDIFMCCKTCVRVQIFHHNSSKN